MKNLRSLIKNKLKGHEDPEVAVVRKRANSDQTQSHMDKPKDAGNKWCTTPRSYNMLDRYHKEGPMQLDKPKDAKKNYFKNK